jgi:hypothetical protein
VSGRFDHASSASRSDGAANALETPLAALVLAAAVIWSSWPLAANLRSSLPDPMASGGRIELWTRMDLDLVVWALAWVAHALATAPARLFDANLFHPAPNALASSEHFLGLAPIATPIFLASGDAILTHNLTVLVVVWSTAFAAFLVVRSWGGSAAAGLLAGIALGLSPYSTSGWVRLHWSAFSLLPVILWLGRRTAAEARPRLAAMLFVVTTLQLTAGMYLAFQTAAALAVFFPLLAWEARRHGQRLLPVLAALGLAGLVLLAVAIPYLPGERGTDAEAALEVLSLTTVPAAALAADLVADSTWPIVLLALAGVAWAPRRDRALRLSLLAVGLLGFALACGPGLPLLPGTDLPGPYRIAMELVPGFARMRTPVRFLSLPLVALTLLAGLATADLLRRFQRRLRPGAQRIAAASVVVAAVLLLVVRAPAEPLALTDAVPRGDEAALIEWLRERPDGGAVLELPVPGSQMDVERMLATGRAMIASTRHWHPLVNGYSGHPPRSARLLLDLAERLPDPDAFADLCALAAPRYLVVRSDLLLDPRPWQGAAERLSLREAARFGATTVYEVDRPCGSLTAALLDEISGSEPASTLRGVPLDALPTEALQGRVDAMIGTPFGGGAFLRVVNESGSTWPGLSTAPRGRVAVAARWIALPEGTVWRVDPAVPLARDLGPGEKLRLVLTSLPPTRPGRYRIEIGLLQEGSGWFADRQGRGLFTTELEVAPGS